MELDISAIADDQPTVYLRWTMGPTDGGWQYCGWNIDDIEVQAVELFVPAAGDYNHDGQVSLADYASFADCMTGPDGGPCSDGCGVFDFDGDEDVDLADFSGMQEAME